MIPTWLHVLSIAMLLAGFACAAALALDIRRRPQPMGVMNLVWPITGLYAGPLAVWFYRRHGRADPGAGTKPMHHGGPSTVGHDVPPEVVTKGATHCGAGCTLGDIVAEWLVFLVPAVAVWFGYGSLFGERIFATWVIDFLFAFVLGVLFQYAALKPMSDAPAPSVLWRAVKVDALSLISWQVGMYGFMAIAHFWIFARLLGTRVEVTQPLFWAAMQVAMLCGFVTAYPVNRWLIGRGIKEAM